MNKKPFVNANSVDQIIRVKAPAKINLHLEVLGLRNDGFHELAMVMQSIDLADYIEMFDEKDGDIRLTVNDSSLSTDDDNLIVKAAMLLRERSGIKSLGAVINLEKNIPIGAGLAGGSSDAAATLLGLNSLWKLRFDDDQLIEMASELGSDVPFCFEGGTKLCFGRGEKLENLKDFGAIYSMAIVLVKDPLVSISTPLAYKSCKEINGHKYLRNESDFENRRKLLRESSWLNPSNCIERIPLKNDLQDVMSTKTPSVLNSLRMLSDLPDSIGSGMSGSGPSCFALFPTYGDAKKSLEMFRNKFESAGLECWCCPLLSKGVHII